MTKAALQKRLAENPALREALEIAIADQWKYKAEPVFAKTGKGFLRSTGVSEQQAVKDATRSSEHPPKARK
jgi:hypothetical protein